MSDIKFPITVNKIEFSELPRFQYRKTGAWVAVRPCDKELSGKTFLGVYLGDMSLSSFVSYDKKSVALRVLPFQNPAIYVPDLKRVVWGCGSWWGEIKSPDDLRQITDADINDAWYVRALKELSGAEAPHA